MSWAVAEKSKTNNIHFPPSLVHSSGARWKRFYDVILLQPTPLVAKFGQRILMKQVPGMSCNCLAEVPWDWDDEGLRFGV